MHLEMAQEPSVQEKDLRPLTEDDIEQVDGGFVCGGVCVAVAFTAGAAVGGGLTWWALSD
ncbi:hypothetical protein [Saccharospirillum salsuginis]|uniref:Uncharacterized protein n=1 Tax=Saccharospirillum salsuginis TaxID=418750 RepID=A0A918KBH7_9GAMM|nr:hypothetical protein [Saccharospirillum salsuginis]GGX57855.1 hypothetical protein GCM10007392_26900 [Saccharospirillum salsuginis]